MRLLFIRHSNECLMNIRHSIIRLTFVCRQASRGGVIRDFHGAVRAHTNICSHKPGLGAADIDARRGRRPSGTAPRARVSQPGVSRLR
jgi:hypothetical protein